MVDRALRSVARKLLEEPELRGTTTFEEILSEIPPEERGRFTPTRIGMHLKALNVRTTRSWDANKRRWVSMAVLVEPEDEPGEPPMGDDAPTEP